jgi:hypothetical protein
MKISKQERILIVVFLVAAIIGVGVFVFVLPNFNKIGANNKQLATAKQEYSNVLSQLEHESTIDTEISQAYEEGKNLAETFYSDLTEYEADEIMRQFIAKGKNITVDGLNVSPFTTQSLSVSVFTPTEVTYPLKDFANTVVEQPDVTTDISSMSTRELVMYAKQVTATLLAASDPVTVGSITVSFTAHSDKLQNLHDFVNLLYDGIYNDKIKGADGKPLSKATYLSSVEYQMEEKTASTDESAAATKDFEMDLSVSFLCIQPVADPFAANNSTAE